MNESAGGVPNMPRTELCWWEEVVQTADAVSGHKRKRREGRKKEQIPTV